MADPEVGHLIEKYLIGSKIKKLQGWQTARKKCQTNKNQWN